jgi:hypothetical protein
MKLYKVKTLFLGKDLNREAIMGFVIAENDKGAFTIVSEEWAYWHEVLEDWRYSGFNPRADRWERLILKDHGDFNHEYRGEFFDQKFAWECLGDITDSEIAILKKLGILPLDKPTQNSV